MENKKKNKDAVEDFYSKIAEHLSDSPQEELSTTISAIRTSKKYVWRPNNYRRQIEVKEKNNCIISTIKSTIQDETKGYKGIKIKIGKHNKHIFVYGLRKGEVTIQYAKHKLTAMYNQKKKGKHPVWFVVEGLGEEVVRKLYYHRDVIREKLDATLNKFIKDFGLRLDNKKPIWERSESAIKGDDFIDSIPQDCIIHTTNFKKVYRGESEFQSRKDEDPTFHISNYIKNRSMEDITPEIVKELIIIKEASKKSIEAVNHLSTRIIPILSAFSKNIKSHTSVIVEMVRAVKQFNGVVAHSRFKKKQKYNRCLEDWL